MQKLYACPKKVRGKFGGGFVYSWQSLHYYLTLIFEKNSSYNKTNQIH